MDEEERLPRDRGLMEEFRVALVESQLEDMGYLGPRFTWERINLSKNNIRERLDRGVANLAWWMFYPIFLFITYRILSSITDWVEQLKKQKAGLSRNFVKRLDHLGNLDKNDETLSKLINVKLHLNMVIEKEKLYWEQRARANRLKMGDQNTTFFHKFASKQHHTNYIRGLQKDG
ncbi:reverse transcriptase [Gossypium australe]|uniref:Reverse transcriptase n=1 Tax=Gossypium australe TaxID=47621 RepID=A0A5B6UWT0_9ROSI|nr:reverse transcriptase [Gossypium australe]